MKYCESCGAQIDDNATVCPVCGKQVASVQPATTQTESKNSGLKTAAKIFMILGCIASAFCFFIPLCWTLPMTISYNNKVNNHQPVGVGFKICALLFVNTIAGVLMLCDNEN